MYTGFLLCDQILPDAYTDASDVMLTMYPDLHVLQICANVEPPATYAQHHSILSSTWVC